MWLNKSKLLIYKTIWNVIIDDKFEKLNKTKFLIYKEKWMVIIEERTQKLRSHLNKLTLVREKLEFLKNYYKNKIAIIIAPGPGYRDHIDKIKESINENTILICIKRTIRDFDMVCDFHVYNFGHYEEYYYKTFNPIVFYYYDFPLKNQKTICFKHEPKIVDIKMHRGIHTEKNRHIHLLRDCHNLEYDGFTWNDENLGKGEMICPRRLHIMFEMALPLAINIGCKTIILNGWVGGHTYGDPEIPKFSKYLITKINKELEYAIEWSKNLSPYLLYKFNIKLYTICESKYHVKLLTYEDYDNIIKSLI